jgi:DNA-3-methyladenine glycosylase
VAGRPIVDSAAGSAARQSAPGAGPLPATFYERPVLDVAADLIGCVVSVGACAGVIVETEAYHDSEPACHAYVGLTPRTAPLFGPPGRAYVYRSYGIHSMLNAVCEVPAVGAAVLIRALQPVSGLEAMAQRRGVAPGLERRLCSGPGKLCQALGVTLEDNGSDLSDGRVRISARSEGWAQPPITATTRIGITKAVDLPWRFCVTGSRFLSVPVRG